MSKPRKPNNPFVTTSYVGAEYFCDREAETQRIESAISNDRNITLIARRRIGKSTLLKHVATRMATRKKNPYIFVEIDLMRTTTFAEFYIQFAEAINAKKPSGLLKKISEVDLLSRLKLGVKANETTGLPEFTADLKPAEINLNLNKLLGWLEKEEQYVVLVFDEFQQILSYPETHTEGFLRAEMMKHPSIRFVFCGSDQHLLTEMFSNKSRPFYNSTETLTIDVIPLEKYKPFIKNHFAAVKRKISEDALDYIYHACNQETSAIQIFCNQLFESGIPHITEPIAKTLFIDLINARKSPFEVMRSMLKPDSVQFQLLRAISRYDLAESITGTAFMKDNGFTNSSSILKAIKALEKAGLVAKRVGESGYFGYFVDNALMKAWLNTLPIAS